VQNFTKIGPLGNPSAGGVKYKRGRRPYTASLLSTTDQYILHLTIDLSAGETLVE